MHKHHLSYPPPTSLPIITRITQAYKLWHDIVQHLPKNSRYTLGAKVDTVFLEVIELIFIAISLPKEKKIPHIQRAISKFDLLKFFLQISWDTKALDNNKYAMISEPLNEIGKMLGGWYRNLIKETSAT